MIEKLEISAYEQAWAKQVVNGVTDLVAELGRLRTANKMLAKALRELADQCDTAYHPADERARARAALLQFDLTNG